MAKGTCSICERPAQYRGWCAKHYRAWLKHGDPLIDLRPDLGHSVAERFWAKVDKRGPDECWPWLACLAYNGYGEFGVDGRGWWAHRWAYETLVGPVPAGYELDHVCHTRDLTCAGGDRCPHRRCANPAHLEPVTHRENMLRGRSPMANQARQTHCKHGHPFTPENTRLQRKRSGSVSRHCQTCAKAHEAKRDRRRKPS